MAAYAALISLSNNMEQIRNHPRLSTSFDQKQMESLLQRVDILLHFVESYGNSYEGSKKEAEELERQIASAAHAAEDVIESHVVYQILAGSTGKRSSFLENKHIKEKIVKVLEKMHLKKSCLERVTLNLHEIIQDMDSIREKVMKVKEDNGCRVELTESSMAAASSRKLITAGKSKMVGFDGYLTQLLDELTGYESGQQIIPITGMGGIGKTTLARNAYDSLLVVQHFDVRAWVTVSEGYNVREILLETLSCLRKSNDGMDEKTELELGELLHKTLFGRRYLIVLDDMWSIKAWDKIKFFFPNNSNRSRIIVTTRIVEIANHFASNRLALDILDDDLSWKLFCDKVFPQEVCPPELEEPGTKIVKKCKGLPLAIVVIGGLLGNSSRTQHHWENVEKHLRSIVNTVEDNRCLNVLSLSYRHLPARLKPCFLYLGIFPEDDVIRVSRLIKLWVAEGFIKPNEDQSLEEIAESYIKDLVERNLISVHSFRWNGKVKAFCIHDLLRDLCIRVAEKQKFLFVTSELDTPRDINRQRRIIIHVNTAEEDEEEEEYNPRVFDTLKSKSPARSLIFDRDRRVHVKSRLLRVSVGGYSEPRDIIFQQVNLRFLAQQYGLLSTDRADIYRLPSSISLLWNLQTLIITTRVYRVYVPSEIWEMPQLRHLMFNLGSLPEPPPTSNAFVLHNLQTLGRVLLEDFMFSEEVCMRIPNVKKLYVCYSRSLKVRGDFSTFTKLESLHCEFDSRPEGGGVLQSLIKFPNSLKKLTLDSFPLQWKDLSMIGSLPHLEALILRFSTKGPNWDPVEGEFLRLKYLKIVDFELIYWNADDAHFPVLENLVLEHLHRLNEIPSGIGDIHTLKCIDLVYCSSSAALSAIRILKEQESLGNQGLQLKVHHWYKRQVKEFMEQVEGEGLTGINFQNECTTTTSKAASTEIEGQLLRLRFLRIAYSQLKCWNADDTHSQFFRTWFSKNYYLNEIPSGIGEIQKLERISLAYCSDSCTLK